jgi:hypothetical protein
LGARACEQKGAAAELGKAFIGEGLGHWLGSARWESGSDWTRVRHGQRQALARGERERGDTRALPVGEPRAWGHGQGERGERDGARERTSAEARRQP